MANSALRSRNFVLLVLGQVTSLLGNLSLRFALSMYILEATGSATLFSGLLALSMVPTILLSPFGGMLADRADRRKVMVALDALSGLLVLLAGLALPLGNGIPAIAVLLFALSILAAFESPTVQACVPQMLAGEALLRGNAIVSQVQAVASLVTPFLGGLFYAAFGLQPVFAAAVILPKGLVIDGLNDSKKLSEKKREQLFDEITAHAASAIYDNLYLFILLILYLFRN